MTAQPVRSRAWRAVAVLSVVLLLAACGDDGGETAAPPAADGTAAPGDGTDAAAPSGATEGATQEGAAADAGAADCVDIGPVRIGLTSSASDAPFYIADARGYFEDAGITPEFSTFDSAAQMIAPLGGGQLDVGAGAPSAGFYNALTRELGFRIVADKGSMPEGYGYMPLLVRTDLYDSGEVTSPEDFAGLTVAEPAQGTATAATLATILESAGIAYDEVSHEFIGFSEHLTAFQNEAIDASLTTEPSATLIEDQGLAVRIGTPPDWYDNQQLAVILYGEQFIARDDPAGVCTMIAYLRGARDYVAALEDGSVSGEGAEEITQIVTAATWLDPELYRQITPNWVDPDGRVNTDSIEQDYQFFKEVGLLEGDVDLTQVVDTSFAEAAVAELGEWEGQRP